ncbi:ABC transporter ATP-binding protein [Microbacter sp. GSS18]|nr:ABC transporter ATP-binding protein [Microbacter sp. GSS18]
MTGLELCGASRVFRGGAGVFDLELTVGAGEIVALVGLNGAGKTTLMRLALGMLRPDAGDVRVLGHPIGRAPAAAWARVGHLVEMPLTYPELTATQNLEASARLRGADPACVAKSLDRWLLRAYADRRTRRLSLGNRQRVGLAAALQHDPDLLVLDEPTNALDPAGVLVLRDALIERADAGAAVLVSSHHLDEVSRIAHRIVVMNGGRLIGELTPGEPELERVFFEHVRADDAQRTVRG